jgi:hypothetical protein
MDPIDVDSSPDESEQRERRFDARRQLGKTRLSLSQEARVKDSREQYEVLVSRLAFEAAQSPPAQ